MKKRLLIFGLALLTLLVSSSVALAGGEPSDPPIVPNPLDWEAS